MLAIHNQAELLMILIVVANAFAKLSKCQQFTTKEGLPSAYILLQTLLQSYQNVSNSQPKHCICAVRSRCKRFCKVIKMLAIHNDIIMDWIGISVANAFAKLSKCQQFTTIYGAKFKVTRLQTLLQSYQNVSNSQLFFH